jgi:hypothetical protein
MRWVALSFIFLGELARAADLSGYQLNNVWLEYRRFHETNQIPELFGRKAKEGLAICLDSTLAKWGDFEAFWSADVHSLTDNGQYRLVGLLNNLGFKWRWLAASYEHHSQHLLDASPSPDHFPVQDALLVRFTLYTR